MKRVSFRCTLEFVQSRKITQSSILLSFFPSTDGNIEKPAKAGSRFQEKHQRNILGTASNRTRPFLELTRNLSHKFVRKLKAVTRKLSQKFSSTESRILGPLFKLDKFLLNPQERTQSGTVPGTSRSPDF